MTDSLIATNRYWQLVSQVRRLELWVPRIVLGLCLLLGSASFLQDLFHGRLNLISLLLGLACGWLISIPLRWGAERLLIKPVRFLRFSSVARGLAARAGVFHTRDNYRWMLGSPGILLQLRDNRLLICGEETEYEELILAPAQIAEVRIERQATAHTVTRQKGRLTIGGGNSLFSAWTFGGKSRSTTTLVETIFLEIAFRGGPSDAFGSVAIPFGTDSRAAGNWRVSLDYLARAERT